MYEQPFDLRFMICLLEGGLLLGKHDHFSLVPCRDSTRLLIPPPKKNGGGGEVARDMAPGSNPVDFRGLARYLSRPTNVSSIPAANCFLLLLF